MPYQPIIGTLGYVLSRDKERVLLIHRNTRASDHALGKYNGLGGKLEPDEDVATCMIREISEEAGITVISMHLRGTINWPGFGPNGEHWLGFVFLIDAWTGVPIVSNPEGTLHWIPLNRLLAACAPDTPVREHAALPMWPGDLHFVPLVFDNNPAAFHGVMPYSQGAPVGWHYVRF